MEGGRAAHKKEPLKAVLFCQRSDFFAFSLTRASDAVFLPDFPGPSGHRLFRHPREPAAWSDSPEFPRVSPRIRMVVTRVYDHAQRPSGASPFRNTPVCVFHAFMIGKQERRLNGCFPVLIDFFLPDDCTLSRAADIRPGQRLIFLLVLLRGDFPRTCPFPAVTFSPGLRVSVPRGYMKLRLLTINVHKGFSLLPRRFVLPRLRKYIHSTSADIIFMQEVVGENIRKAAKHPDWPAKPQYQYVAEAAGFKHIYGRHSVYAAGHHGNAILSRFPVLRHEKMDLSVNRFEKKGFLYGEVELPRGRGVLNCVCVHLGLFYRARKKQFGKLKEFIQRVAPGDAPLIVAGDFNEWRRKIKEDLASRLGMRDAGLEVFGKRLRTFPAMMPVFPLDSIYVRGFKVLKARILNRGGWKELSDHAGFFVEIEPE